MDYNEWAETQERGRGFTAADDAAYEAAYNRALLQRQARSTWLMVGLALIGFVWATRAFLAGAPMLPGMPAMVALAAEALPGGQCSGLPLTAENLAIAFGGAGIEPPPAILSATQATIGGMLVDVSSPGVVGVTEGTSGQDKLAEDIAVCLGWKEAPPGYVPGVWHGVGVYGPAAVE